MTAFLYKGRPAALSLFAGLLAGSIITNAVSALQTTRQDMELAATRAAIAAVKSGIVNGHRTKDKGALDTLYLDTYTAADVDGTVRSKHDLLADLPNAATMLDGRYELIAVRQWGNIAVASGRGRMTYRNADGSNRVSEYNSVNVFERINGKWKYAAAFLP